MRTSSHNTTCWQPGLPQPPVFPQLAPALAACLGPLHYVFATSPCHYTGTCSWPLQPECIHYQLWSLLQLASIPSCWRRHCWRYPKSMQPLPTACYACQGPISGWCYECKRLPQYNHIIEISNILLKNFQLSASFLALIFRWDSLSYLSYLNKMYLSL